MIAVQPVVFLSALSTMKVEECCEMLAWVAIDGLLGVEVCRDPTNRVGRIFHFLVIFAIISREEMVPAIFRC